MYQDPFQAPKVRVSRKPLPPLANGADVAVYPSLPADHEYVQKEIQDMAQQLEHERMLVGDATTKTLLKEMWLIPSNRKRAIISIALMIWQQMTGVNAVVSYPA